MIRSLMRTLTAIALFLLPLLLSAQKKEKPGILWRISGNGLAKPSYLFGTMHLKDKQLFNFPDSLYAAIEQTEGFAMELHPDSLVQAVLDKEDKSKRVSEVLKPESFNRIKKKLATQFKGKPEDVTLEELESYCISRYYRIESENSMNTFMDTYLYGAAARSGKWTGGIEDVEDQLGLNGHTSPESTASEFLETDQAIRRRLDSMIAVYLGGHIKFMALMTAGDASMIKRNHKMALRMDSMMTIRTMLFAVGAGHLAGKEGVVELLRGKGYTVDSVVFSGREFILDHKFNIKEKPWVTVKDKSGLYIAQMPGQPMKDMEVPGTEGAMKMYIDLQSGLSYFTFAIVAKKGLALDSLASGIVKRFNKDAVLKSVKPIKKDGFEGREVIAESPAMNLNSRFYLADGYCYGAFIAYEPASLILANDMSKFFEAFTMYRPTAEMLAPRKAIEFTSVEAGFKVELPLKPSVERESGENNVVWQYSSLDNQNEVGYIMIAHLLNDEMVFQHDSLELSNYLAGQEARDNARVLGHRYDSVNGYPAIWITFRASVEGDSLDYKALKLLRGRRSYFFIAYARSQENIEQYCDRFFSSISFFNTENKGWKEQAVPGESFTLWSPAPLVRAADSLEDTSLRKWVVSDTLNATSVILIKVPFTKYQRMDSDTALLRKAVMAYTGINHEMLGFDFTKNGEFPAVSTEAKLPPAHTIRRLRSVLSNDALYYIFVSGAPKDLEDPQITKLLNEFRPSGNTDFTALYASKTEMMISDMSSSDSMTSVDAYEGFRNTVFKKEDLPFLYNALKNQYNENLYRVHEKIEDAILELRDTTSIEVLKDLYLKLTPGNDTARVAILSVLAGWQTTATHNLAIDLLQANPPATAGMPHFVTNFFDSSELALPHYHQLMYLLKDSNTVTPLMYQVTRLLTEKKIKAADLASYKTVFIDLAKKAAAVNMKDDEKRIWYYDDVAAVLAALRDPAATAALRKMLSNPDVDMKLDVVKSLLSINQPLPAADLLKIAADRSARLALYDTLVGAKKVALFPKLYLTQRAFGESSLYSFVSDEDYELKNIVFVGERVAGYKGKKQKFYLYKLTFDVEEGGSYLGITGPYPVTPTTKLKQYSEVDGMYYDEEYNASKLDTMLKAYLKGFEENESE
ncbi:MAG TPA: TraB/GumN family protein [Pseudobacter sp.]|nr:TraB/GumN family protein [Pseudobacter sp.]